MQGEGVLSWFPNVCLFVAPVVKRVCVCVCWRLGKGPRLRWKSLLACQPPSGAGVVVPFLRLPWVSGGEVNLSKVPCETTSRRRRGGVVVAKVSYALDKARSQKLKLQRQESHLFFVFCEKRSTPEHDTDYSV